MTWHGMNNTKLDGLYLKDRNIVKLTGKMNIIEGTGVNGGVAGRNATTQSEKERNIRNKRNDECHQEKKKKEKEKKEKMDKRTNRNRSHIITPSPHQQTDRPTVNK